MSNKVDLEGFASGALTAKFNMAYQEVLDNIADPNTPFKTKRKLILELTFQTDEERELTTVDIRTKTKLAAAKSIATKIIIDRDGHGGIIASEYGKQMKGQQYMKTNEETGEIITTEENEVDIQGIQLVK